MSERKHTSRKPHLDKKFTNDELFMLDELKQKFDEFKIILLKRYGRGYNITSKISRMHSILNAFSEMDKEH